MTDAWHEGEDLPSNVVKRYLGRPTEIAEAKEATRWGRFLVWLCPHLARKHELAERFLRARVLQEEAKARVFAEEAAEIAARTVVAQQDAVKTLCDIVDENLDVDTQLTQVLKLAKVLETYEDLPRQIEKIKNMMESLHINYGADIEIVTGQLVVPVKDAVSDEIG